MSSKSLPRVGISIGDPNGIGVEDLAFLAWEASKQAKIVVPGEFDKYIAKLESVEVIAEELENPTHAELTEGS